MGIGKVANENFSSFMEYVWAPFVALFWWFINRLTSKVDDLEKNKATKSSTSATVERLDKQIHVIDKKITELGHTSVPRAEFKSDIGMLHQRANELEKTKKDRVVDVRIVDENNKPGKK